MGKRLKLRGGYRVFVTMHKLPATIFRSLLKKDRDVATPALPLVLIHRRA
jgi:hypothetical protein